MEQIELALIRQRLMQAMALRQQPTPQSVLCERCQQAMSFICDQAGRVLSSDCLCHRYRTQFRPH